MTAYTVDILIALEEGERVTRRWWAGRLAWGTKRAGGGLPPEISNPLRAPLTRQTDPDTGECFACVTLTFEPGTGYGRCREVAHMLTSVLIAEGFTIRAGGRRVEAVPGEHTAPLEGEIGATGYAEARACASRCLTCVFSSEHRHGCCGQGSAFSLADIGSILLAGGEEFIAELLTLPGAMDGVKWHPYLSHGICVFHSPEKGCTLPADRMPLQCRTYLCLPDQLLPAHQLAQYTGYVDALEEAEAFVEDHMRLESGVDFGSPLAELKAAAARAFVAWEAGQSNA